MPVLAGPSAPSVPEFGPGLPTRVYLGDSGIVLGDGSVADDQGCTWKIAGNNVWGPKPAPREQVSDRAAAHGQYDATRFYGPRVLPFTGSCRAPSHAALHAAEQRLRDAVGVQSFVYRATEPGFDSFARMRQQGDLTWTENSHSAGFAHASFAGTLYAPDPLIYSSLRREFGPLRFPTTSGGLSWGPTVSWAPTATWESAVVSGRALLANPGNQPVGVRLRVTGPADTLAIALSTLDQTFHLQDPDGGPILREGEHLLIDTTTHDVLLMGDASRRGWAYGDWLQLPPLSETEIAITGTGVDMTSSGVAGTYRAARI